MVYKYLGYGVTDSNGVAKLDHDAEGQELQHSYTGVGAGEIDVVASLDNPVSSGSIVSKTYPLWDTLFHDEGTGSTPSTNWQNIDFTASSDSNGTTITSTGFATYFADIPSTTGVYEWVTPFVIEMKIVSQTRGQLQIYDHANTINIAKNFSDLGITSNKSLKVVNDGTNVKFYVDGTEVTSARETQSLGTCRVGFRVTDSNGGNITYKNFKIYKY